VLEVILSSIFQSFGARVEVDGPCSAIFCQEIGVVIKPKFTLGVVFFFEVVVTLDGLCYVLAACFVNGYIVVVVAIAVDGYEFHGDSLVAVVDRFILYYF